MNTYVAPGDHRARTAGLRLVSRIGHCAERQAVAPQVKDATDRALLVRIFGEGSVLGHPPAERDDTTEIAPPLAQVGLHVPDVLPDTVALRFRCRREDREHQLRNAVTRHVAAEVDHMQTDASVFQSTEDIERV